MLLVQASEGKEPGNITYNNCIMKESGPSQCGLTVHAHSYYTVSVNSLEFQNMLRAILQT